MSSYFGGNNDKSSEIDEEEPYAGKLNDMIIVENNVKMTVVHCTLTVIMSLSIFRYAINRSEKQTSTICVLPLIFGGHEFILEWCAGRKNICLECKFYFSFLLKWLAHES